MHNNTSKEAAWFYAEDGERHGRLDEAQMIELIRAGRLGRDTPVWKIGYTDWRLLDDSELRPHLDTLARPACGSGGAHEECAPIPPATCPVA